MSYIDCEAVNSRSVPAEGLVVLRFPCEECYVMRLGMGLSPGCPTACLMRSSIGMLCNRCLHDQRLIGTALWIPGCLLFPVVGLKVHPFQCFVRDADEHNKVQ